MIVRGVRSCNEQHDWRRHQFSQRSAFGIGGNLGLVIPAECQSPGRLVVEPFPQLCAWRGFRMPVVKPERRFR